MANSLLRARLSLLALPLLCPSVVADTSGDYWIIHGKSKRYHNEIFIADAAGILHKPQEVQSAMIMRIFEDPDMPLLAAYEVQYKCKERKLRLDSTRTMRRLDYAFKDAATVRDWIDPQHSAYWLQRTYAFVCAPDNREHNQMLPMGRMSNAQMVQAAQALFLQLSGAQASSPAIRDLDAMLGNAPP